LDLITEPKLIPIPIHLEHEQPILDCHIPWLGKECEFQFFELYSALELKLILEHKLDLSHIHELVLVPIPFILEPKSII